MPQFSFKQKLFASLIILSVSGQALAQAALPNPRDQHLAGGNNRAPVIPNGAQPGDKIEVEFNSPYAQNNGAEAIAQALEWRQGQQVEEDLSCAQHLVKTSDLRPGHGSNSDVRMDFCVEDVIALDSKKRQNVGMPPKSYDDRPNTNPSCKVQVLTAQGVRLWVVSDSSSICKLLIDAKTRHPAVSISGYMTSIYNRAVTHNRDGSITLNPIDDAVNVFIGVTSAEYR